MFRWSRCAPRIRKLARLVAGELPGGVDAEAFKARVRAAAAELVATASRTDTITVFSHGAASSTSCYAGPRHSADLPLPLDYVSVTHLRYSGDGKPVVLGVNIEHVTDLLPQLQKR